MPWRGKPSLRRDRPRLLTIPRPVITQASRFVGGARGMRAAHLTAMVGARVCRSPGRHPALVTGRSGGLPAPASTRA